MGFFGDEMVHPKCRVAGESTPLQQALTPVYPTTAGLPQATLRKHIDAALDELALDDTLPAALRQRLRLPDSAPACAAAPAAAGHRRGRVAGNAAHPAWRRIKFDELLAQQLSMRVHHREARQRVAPRTRAAAQAHRRAC